jgi:hypothetical protein
MRILVFVAVLYVEIGGRDMSSYVRHQLAT